MNLSSRYTTVHWIRKPNMFAIETFFMVNFSKILFSFINNLDTLFSFNEKSFGNFLFRKRYSPVIKNANISTLLFWRDRETFRNLLFWDSRPSLSQTNALITMSCCTFRCPIISAEMSVAHSTCARRRFWLQNIFPNRAKFKTRVRKLHGTAIHWKTRNRKKEKKLDSRISTLGNLHPRSNDSLVFQISRISGKSCELSKSWKTIEPARFGREDKFRVE